MEHGAAQYSQVSGEDLLVCKKYIEDIHIFGMNMPFISSSDAKNVYFMSGETTNEIYIFRLHLDTKLVLSNILDMLSME